MATTTVVVNDFTNNKRSVSILGNDEFTKVEIVWADEDQILIDMQKNDFFVGRRRWCDLNPTHFRLMIARNLTIVADMNKTENSAKLEAANNSLKFLFSALVFCLQNRAECLIELLRVARLSESEITYDFMASLNMQIDRQKPKTMFRVVVDNP